MEQSATDEAFAKALAGQLNMDVRLVRAAGLQPHELQQHFSQVSVQKKQENRIRTPAALLFLLSVLAVGLTDHAPQRQQDFMHIDVSPRVTQTASGLAVASFLFFAGAAGIGTFRRGKIQSEIKERAEENLLSPYNPGALKP